MGIIRVRKFYARCPICRRPFTAPTEEEVIVAVKEHSLKQHKKEAHKIKVKQMKTLKKA